MWYYSGTKKQGALTLKRTLSPWDIKPCKPTAEKTKREGVKREKTEGVERVNPWDGFNSLAAITQFIEKQEESYFEDVGVITLDSHKIEVSNKGGKYRVAMVYLAQSNISGHEVCPHATESCKGICLGSHSGHGAMVKRGTDYNTCRIGRVKKTIMFFNYRELFMRKLFAEMTNFCEQCKVDGIIPAFRFNATSDLMFHTFTAPVVEGTEQTAPNFIQYFGEKFNVSFYDYSKSVNKMEKYISGKLPENYNLTFSFTPEKAADAFKVLAMGGNVAVAFNSKDKNTFVGKKFNGFEIINGDLTDLRFLDPKGFIVGLSPKGHIWKKDTSGFFVNTATLA